MTYETKLLLREALELYELGQRIGYEGKHVDKSVLQRAAEIQLRIYEILEPKRLTELRELGITKPEDLVLFV